MWVGLCSGCPQHLCATCPQAFEEHLVILWEKARHFEADLLKEVRGKFSLQWTQELAWQPDCFLYTMHAFYELNFQFMEKKVWCRAS